MASVKPVRSVKSVKPVESVTHDDRLNGLNWLNLCLVSADQIFGSSVRQNTAAAHVADDSHIETVGQIQRQAGGSGAGNQHGDVHFSCFDENFRGNAACGYQDFVSGVHFVQETLSQYHIYRIVTANVGVKDQNALGISETAIMDSF